VVTGVLGGAVTAVRLPSPLTQLVDDRLDRRGLRLALKRDDLINQDVPGNKWRKLRLNLDAAAAGGYDQLLTFGGAWSNHIRAVAAAGRLCGFASVGVVRGEPHLPLNPVLQWAVGQGMRLAYLDRLTYRHAVHGTPAPDLVASLQQQWGPSYVLPEGGSNDVAVTGCVDVAQEIGPSADVVCCPVGTGGTLAGIAAGLRPGQEAVGFSVLKGQFLTAEVERLQRTAFGSRQGRWRVEQTYHFGGYAKTTPELEAFACDFRARHGVRLDSTYTAKMMYGIYDLASQGVFPPGTRLVAVITG
jgi:1-aminocyclopropane-1-carboxylate deaminase